MEESFDSRDRDRLPDVIHILGNDYVNIYSVDRETRQIEIYRYRNRMFDIEERMQDGTSYETLMKTYIESDVAPEDRQKMFMETDFSTVCERLGETAQFTIHYRVKRDGLISYYYLKCARVGGAEEFKKIVFAFANEDMDVRRNELTGLMGAGGISAKRKVLVVEDNELNREILSSFLGEKYEVIQAENGEEGLALLAEYYRELSVVLLDICMPVCDGYEFLRRRNKEKVLSAVPVIVMTGSRTMDAELQCLDLGAVDFIPKPYNSRIVMGRINNVISLRESAHTLSIVERDELTGIYTRQAFFYHAKTLMQIRPGESFHLLVADIRDFKSVNSSYGNKTGDKVLRYLADTYAGMVNAGIVCRYGGDQFACLTYGTCDLTEKYIKKIAGEISHSAPIPTLMMKYGVYENVDRSLEVPVICDRAFMALKDIQDNYENSVAYYTREMEEKRIFNRALEKKFDKAISNKEFVAFFQPKYSTATEEITGAESLVRWIEADGSMVMPGDFIPLYERDGLIVRLDEYIFRYVCEFQRERMKQGKELIPVSVNLSRASIYHTGVVERYAEIVRENEIPFSSVPIELTETAAIYSNKIGNFTEQLVNAGFVLHMDDFGSGYSSMITLNEMPFSTLKIDKSLIDYIEQDKGKMIVKQVIILAHGLGMNVTAEGAETLSQIELLREMGCDDIQGFYYSRPLPGDEFIRKLEEED